jgi:hypothetical protein
VNSGFDYKVISAAGSAVIKNIPGRVTGYHVNGAYVGTVVLHDNAAGTTTITPLTIGTPNAYPSAPELNVGFKQGIYYVASGTPTITVFFE